MFVTEQAFHEAVRRGFRTIRLEAESPRMIAIIQKLMAKGVVKSTVYVRSPVALLRPGSRLTTSQIMDTPHHLDTLDAEAFLRTLPLDVVERNTTAESDGIECVLCL